MYIKIQPHDPSKDIIGIVAYLDKQNQHRKMVEYLDKQNKELGKTKEREYFFSSKSEKVGQLEVMDELGKNHQGLRGKDAKFFMVTINPSQNELKHLEGLYGSEKQGLKSYTKDVMKGYAFCMNREVEGRKLEEKDLRWYGMYEDSRKYGRRDKEVLHNRDYNRELKAISKGAGDKESLDRLGGFYVLDKEGKVQKRRKEEKGEVKIKEGLKKAGKHGHVHVLVHRKDRSGKLSLSPLAHARGGKTNLITTYYKQGKKISKRNAELESKKEGKKLGEGSIEVKQEKVQIGFNRNYFKEYCQSAFDYKFDYDRPENERFENYNKRKKELKVYVERKREGLKQIGIKARKGLVLGNLKSGLKDTLGINELKDHLVEKEVKKGYDGGKLVVKVGLDLAKEVINGSSPGALALSIVKKGISLGVKLIDTGIKQSL